MSIGACVKEKLLSAMKEVYVASRRNFTWTHTWRKAARVHPHGGPGS